MTSAMRFPSRCVVVILTRLLMVAGLRMSCTVFAMKLAEKLGHLIAVEIQIHKMGGVAKNLSDQLSSTILRPCCSFFSHLRTL